MQLGIFSVSLSVKNLEESRVFYTKIGFEVFVDKSPQKYIIMRNGQSIIGLFEGMFANNLLTFNPGWDYNAQNIENFDDVREIQKEILKNEISLLTKADEATSGPASIMLTDPDGNMILIDQHR